MNFSSVRYRSCSACRSWPHSTGNSNCLAGRFQDVDRLGVAEPAEVAGDDVLAAGSMHALVDVLGEELHVLLAVGQHVAADALQEPLGQRHVVGQLEERRLRLDHPELGQVPRRVRVLGAKRRAERVNLAERRGVDFAFELAGDGEIRRPLEEVLRVVDLALVVPRRLGRVDRRDAEHLARPLRSRWP